MIYCDFKRFMSKIRTCILICPILMLNSGAFATEGLLSEAPDLSGSQSVSVPFSDTKQLFRLLDPSDLMEDSLIWNAESLEEIRRHFTFFSKDCYPEVPLNFGVVINNDHYQLYRSQALGTKGVDLIFDILRENALILPSKVIFMNKEGYANSSVSKKMSEYFDIARGMGPFAYEEEELFSDSGKYSSIDFFHPLSHDVFLSGQNPLEDVPFPHQIQVKDGKFVNLYASRGNFFRVLGLILENQGSALFHCTGGLHRTGMISLAIRHMQGGVWLKDFKKPITVRSRIFWQYKLRNLAEVEYYLHNPWKFRMININAMRTISDQPEFQELKNKYKTFLNLPSRCAVQSEL